MSNELGGDGVLSGGDEQRFLRMMGGTWEEQYEEDVGHKWRCYCPRATKVDRNLATDA